jgi:hypothetical protein
MRRHVSICSSNAFVPGRFQSTDDATFVWDWLPVSSSRAVVAVAIVPT